MDESFGTFDMGLFGLLSTCKSRKPIPVLLSNTAVASHLNHAQCKVEIKGRSVV
jgi:hypothetical protein